MLRTQYASGRNKLAAPTITTSSGNIQGNNITYYFWLKARNRVGYNVESNVTSVTLANNSSVSISPISFSTYDYEDWRHIILCINTSNNFNTSRVLYKQPLYNSDGVIPIEINSPIVISRDDIINGTSSVDVLDNLPDTTYILNGYRVYVSSLDCVLEFVQGSEETANNLTSFEAVGGLWVAVASNSLTEVTSYYRKELFEVDNEELEKGVLDYVSNGTSSIKYYIFNDSSSPITAGEVVLNNYISDNSIDYSIYTKILGYFNYTTNTLDISDIDFINTDVEYPSNVITLNKALPAYSALVLEIQPNLNLLSALVSGTYLSLYPKINDFATLDTITIWSDPVDDIASLKAIPLSVVINRQTRYVASKNLPYVYDSSSDLDDDGDSVIIPNSNPVIGRWLAVSTLIPNGSIEPEKLSETTLGLFSNGISTTSVTLSTSSTYTINLDSFNFDYIILNTPVDDNNITTINVTATLTSNTSKSLVMELRQNTGAVAFNSSLIFPGGDTPILSGDGKIDLFVILINKDSQGTLKKRIFLVQSDIG